jgi:acetyl esterase/lipase
MHRRALLATLPALVACTPSLGTFDALAPRDGGAGRVVRDAAYGPGARQKLDLYAPADQRDGEALPVLVFFYGGSWRSGDKDDYEFLGAALAAQGFLTAIPDYRLVPEVRFPHFIADCAAAVRWVQDNVTAHGGDPRRVVLAGHSAGAYNAIMLALAADYLRDAGVDAEIVRGAIGLAGPYDFLPFDAEATRNAFGQAPDTALTQPVNFARADAPPLLLLWGEDDDTVGPRNLQSLARVQRAAGGVVEPKTYPGVDHIDILLALSRPFRSRAPVLEDMSAFARRVTA